MKTPLPPPPKLTTCLTFVQTKPHIQSKPVPSLYVEQGLFFSYKLWLAKAESTFQNSPTHFGKYVLELPLNFRYYGQLSPLAHMLWLFEVNLVNIFENFHIIFKD